MPPARPKATRAAFLSFAVLALAARPDAAAQSLVAVTDYALAADGTPLVTVQARADSYYVLEAPHVRDTAYTARSITLGVDGPLVLTEGLEGLRQNRYRVRRYARDAPGDQDGDGRDDLSELADPTRSSPLNSARPTDPADGATAVRSDAAFAALARRQDGPGGGAPLLVSKIYLVDNRTDSVAVYFMNVNRHVNHVDFARATGIPTSPNGTSFREDMRGTIVYHPDLTAPNGQRGLYTFYFGSFNEYDFALNERAYDILAANMPFLRGRLAYRPFHQRSIATYERQRDRYVASRMRVVTELELFPELDYLALNRGVGYGRLRRMDPADTPSPFDIVVYAALPNELPRTGGILSEAVQTPLSHVNLRALQDSVPNAYLRGAFTHPDVLRLEGQYVRLEAGADTFSLRAATVEEVDAHYASLRPDTVTVLRADLSQRDIVSLRDIGFAEALTFGAKAANVAELHRVGLPAGTVPEGYALPFAMYADYMADNGFDAEAAALVARLPTLSFPEQEDELRALRRRVRRGTFSPDARAALTALQGRFAEAQPIRCRSSSNGEDLIGFNGAGLYDSKTQRPDEGHLEKSVREVYASLWTYRAYLEREFYRIDHGSAYMGVLVHANFDDERVNGVAVATDPRFGRADTYYVNAQLGEDLVTNPEPGDRPEELLIARDPLADPSVLRIGTSSLLPPEASVVDSVYIERLRSSLTRIQGHFAALYGAEGDEGFAMEIEWKVDRDGRYVVKQARPWVGAAVGTSSLTEASAFGTAGPIFPNPTSGEVSLSLKLETATTLRFLVYDMLGRRLLDEAVAAAAGRSTLRLPSLTGLRGAGPLAYELRGERGGVLRRGVLLVR